MKLCIVPQIKSPHFTTPSIQGYRLHNNKEVEMAVCEWLPKQKP